MKPEQLTFPNTTTLRASALQLPDKTASPGAPIKLVGHLQEPEAGLQSGLLAVLNATAGELHLGPGAPARTGPRGHRMAFWHGEAPQGHPARVVGSCKPLAVSQHAAVCTAELDPHAMELSMRAVSSTLSTSGVRT